MFHDENNKSEGIVLSPKASFLVGLLGGVMVLCTIGFFILLSVVLKGGLPAGGGEENGQQQAAAPAQPSAPSAPVVAGDDEPTVVGPVKPVSSTDNVLGSKNATVTLYEWSDFQCPFCQRFHPEVKQLVEEFDGKVRWVYRHFPLSFHPNALPAALASECAAEQGKFWEFADKLFENQETLGDALYKKLADDLKLSRSKFDSCLSSKKYESEINQQLADGSAAGVNGTPGTIIMNDKGDKQLVPGAVPYAQLKSMIEASLNQ